MRLLLVLSLCLVGVQAAADDLATYEQAMSAYARSDYPAVIALLEPAAGGNPPSFQSEILILEARKHLAISYMFEGNPERARALFLAILDQEPSYELDPVQVPAAALTLFAEAQGLWREQQRTRNQAQSRAEAEERDRELRRLAFEEAYLSAIEELAREEVVTRQNSRWVGLFPFGLGQFQNGHRTAGIVFATLEGICLLASVVGFFWHESLRGQRDIVLPSQREDYVLQERVARYLSQVSVATFGVLWVTGVVDAQLRFVPEVRSVRTRELPSRADFELSFAGIRMRF